MTKAELIKALDSLPNDAHISVWRDHRIYNNLEVDVFTDGEDDTIVELAHINIYDHHKEPQMTHDEIQKVQQALMLADMFFIATPIATIEKMGNPLGKVLRDAINITLEYTD
jgi:hypothetical protein